MKPAADLETLLLTRQGAGRVSSQKSPYSQISVNHICSIFGYKIKLIGNRVTSNGGGAT